MSVVGQRAVSDVIQLLFHLAVFSGRKFSRRLDHVIFLSFPVGSGLTAVNRG
jgi:hypothetical protein